MDKRVTVRAHTAMNTVIPGLMVVLAALVVLKAATIGIGSLALILFVLAALMLGVTVRLMRSGVVVIEDGRLIVRGHWRTESFATTDIDHLEVDGVGATPSLVHADSLVVVTRDGNHHHKSDFEQSSYGRSRRGSLGWLCDEVNGRLAS